MHTPNETPQLNLGTKISPPENTQFSKISLPKFEETNSRVLKTNSFNFSQKTLKTYLKAFQSFDSTQNGYLLPADLRNMFGLLGINMERGEIFQILCEYDEMEKGYIDFNDFMKIMSDKISFHRLPDPPNETNIFKGISWEGGITEDSLKKAYCRNGFVIKNEEVKEIFEFMKSYFGEDCSSDPIKFQYFQKLLLGCHQELGFRLRKELNKI